jgi:DNA-binding MarR family transcriptional regulator
VSAGGAADIRLDDVAFPALLRAARDTYATETRQRLAASGYADLPRNGSFVLGAIARTGAPLADIVSRLGVSKQAAGQLVDTLVTRGYLSRETDASDRRRLTVRLTERGRDAARVARQAIEAVDARVVAQVGRDALASTRTTLASIAELRPVTDR